MLTLLAIIASSVAIFFIAFLSPLKGSFIQHHLDRLSKRLYVKLGRQPSAVQFLLRFPSTNIHKVLTRSARFGKNSRFKLPM